MSNQAGVKNSGTGAGVGDILTALKNINTSLSAQTSAQKRALGNLTTVVITAPTQVIVGSGRLVSFSVTVAGSGPGSINNATLVSSAVAANELCGIPNSLGIVTVGMEFNLGLVVTPGSGQSVCLTYYSGP